MANDELIIRVIGGVGGGTSTNPLADIPKIDLGNSLEPAMKETAKSVKNVALIGGRTASILNTMWNGQRGDAGQLLLLVTLADAINAGISPLVAILKLPLKLLGMLLLILMPILVTLLKPVLKYIVPLLKGILSMNKDDQIVLGFSVLVGLISKFFGSTAGLDIGLLVGGLILFDDTVGSAAKLIIGAAMIAAIAIAALTGSADDAVNALMTIPILGLVIKTVIDAIAATTGEIAEKLKPALDAAKPIIEGFTGAIGFAVAFVGNFSSAVIDAANQLVGLGDKTLNLVTGSEFYRIVIGNLNKLIPLLKASFEGLKGIIDAILAPFQAFKDLLSGFGLPVQIGNPLESTKGALQTGGRIFSSGAYNLHEGETVVPRNGGGGGTTINITVNGGLGDTKALAKELGERIQSELRRRNSYGTVGL